MDPVLVRLPDLRGQDGMLSNGRVVGYSVFAANSEDAVAITKTTLGIDFGSPYIAQGGAVVDADLVLVDFTHDQRMPINDGATGEFYVYCRYGNRETLYGNRLPPIVAGGPARVRVVPETTEEVADTFADTNRTPIRNTANEPIDPPPTIRRVYYSLVLEWIRTNDNWLAAFQSVAFVGGKVNSAVFYGAPQRCLYAHPIEVEEVQNTGIVKLYKFTGRFDFRPQRTVKSSATGGSTVTLTIPGWDGLFPNLGRRVKTNPANADHPYRELREWVGAVPAEWWDLTTGNAQQKQDYRDSALISHPLPLNTAGNGVLTDLSLTNWITGPLYDEADFNILGV